MENKKPQDDDPNLTAYLKEELKRSYKERFLMANRLYKIQQMMQKATITHKPYIGK